MSDYSIVYYKDIESRKIEWLWYPYIRTERLPLFRVTLEKAKPHLFSVFFLSEISTQCFSFQPTELKTQPAFLSSLHTFFVVESYFKHHFCKNLAPASN